jgi:hypothetical protein
LDRCAGGQIDQDVRVYFHSTTSGEIKVRRAQSKLDFPNDPIKGAVFSQHNISGWQANFSTTNGIFSPKIAEINVVPGGRFFYYFDLYICDPILVPIKLNLCRTVLI